MTQPFRQTHVGGLDETWSVPSGRAVRPEAASSVGPVAIHYRASLRPCLGTAIAPRRRARFRQTLLVSSSATGEFAPGEYRCLLTSPTRTFGATSPGCRAWRL